MNKPVYTYSTRWGRLLRTDRSPAGYGRICSPAAVILSAAQRAAQRRESD